MRIGLFLALAFSAISVEAINLKDRMNELSELEAACYSEAELEAACYGEGSGDAHGDADADCPNCGGKAQCDADGEGEIDADVDGEGEKEGKGEGFSDGAKGRDCAPSTDQLRREAREALARLHAREQEHCAQCAGRLTCCNTGGACPCGAGYGCGAGCGYRPACGTTCGATCARPACGAVMAVQPLQTKV